MKGMMKREIKRLREKGVVITLQRLAILQYLENNKTHPSVEEIYRSLKKKYPILSKATVYTSLQVLRKAGEIQELSIRKDKTCFDSDPKPHHHFYCQECRRVLDIEISCPLAKKGWIDGHKVKQVQGYFYGICSRCLKKAKNN